MELQELALTGVSSQIRYDLSPRFIDVRGRFIDELTTEMELPQWGWGNEVLNFHSEQDRLTIVAGGREARTQFESVGDSEDVVAVTRRLFDKVLTAFEVKEVTFIGVRTYWVGATDNFDELRDWMVTSFTSHQFQAAFGHVGSLSDVGWVGEFMASDPKHRLSLGPMTREQLVERVLQAARPDDLPDNFLFMDLDRIYNETRHSPSAVADKWEESFRRSLALASTVGQELTGERPLA